MNMLLQTKRLILLKLMLLNGIRLILLLNMIKNRYKIQSQYQFKTPPRDKMLMRILNCRQIILKMMQHLCIEKKNARIRSKTPHRKLQERMGLRLNRTLKLTRGLEAAGVKVSAFAPG